MLLTDETLAALLAALDGGDLAAVPIAADRLEDLGQLAEPRVRRLVLDRPESDGRRLLYAEERERAGDDALAEFVRVQVALPQTQSTCGSEGGDYLCRSMGCPLCPLIRRQNAAWLRLPIGHGIYEFAPTPFRLTIFAGPDAAPPVAHVRRGFVPSVQCPLAAWEEHGPLLVSRHPVERVDVTDMDGGLVQTDREPPFSDYWIAHYSLWTNHPWLSPFLADLGRPIYDRGEALRKLHDCLSAACLAWARQAAEERGMMP